MALDKTFTVNAKVVKKVTSTPEIAKETSPKIPAIGIFERIQKAMEILKAINQSHVHNDLRPTFLNSMYANTLLQRKEQEPQRGALTNNVPSTSTSAAREERLLESKTINSVDGVLRKNIYYLASLLVDFDRVMTESIQQGVFTFDEKDAIVDPLSCLGDTALKSLKLYATLITKCSADFLNFKRILKATNNEKSADLLKLKPASTVPSAVGLVYLAAVAATAAAPAAGPSRNIRSGQTRPVIKVVSALAKKSGSSSWTCAACTFKNPRENNICEICSRAKDGTNSVAAAAVENLDVGPACPRCTFINEIGTELCTICGVQL